MQPSNCLISCFIYKVSIQLRSKIRDYRDKRDSWDLRDPAKNPGPGPRRKIRKSGIWDRDSKLKNPGSGTGTGTQICGTRDSGTQLWGTENFPGHGPVPTPGRKPTFLKFLRFKIRFSKFWFFTKFVFFPHSRAGRSLHITCHPQGHFKSWFLTKKHTCAQNFNSTKFLLYNLITSSYLKREKIRVKKSLKSCQKVTLSGNGIYLPTAALGLPCQSDRS